MDEVFTTHQACFRDRELLTPNNPLSPQLNDFAAWQVTKEIAGRYRTIPAPNNACIVLNANPEFYFIFNEIANKFRIDEFSIGEVAINFSTPNCSINLWMSGMRSSVLELPFLSHRIDNTGIATP